MKLFLGENVKAFEKEFAAFCGVPYAIGVGSGTEALHFALRSLGVGEGDRVITVPFTFIGTVEAILQAGAKPIFVDIDPFSHTIDSSKVEEKITKKTKAIIPVHLYGQPCEMAPLLRLSKKYGVPILEDAAQAHGAMENGEKVGSIGKAGCFSFYYAKNLGAYGEGGMVVTRDKRIAERIRLLRNHGAATKYAHILPGFNGRLDEIQAAVLRIKLRRLSQWNALRRQHAGRYREAFADLPIALPAEGAQKYHVYHLFVIRTRKRDALRKYLLDRDIETGVHYPIPLHLQQALRAFRFHRGDFPESERAASEVLSLPIYPELTSNDQGRIIRGVRRFFKKW
ncbi:MAG: DegT/DnrJ/EryC1/StrS family aminotransferase [Candidatus Omnitrophica bacterium]|nr:DegT/DnrJ/EryC1/StrS family aminotransferase [Candidatus Omnitrophota bacterium]